MTTEKRNDEIDLIELFLNIYIFFKKNFWLFFIAVIIGGGLGYSTKFFAKKHYESAMLINSYTVSENLLIKYFNIIQSLIEDNNLSYLSERMGIDTLNLESLKEIKAEMAYDEKDERKSLGYLTVSVNVLDNEILLLLNNGLLKYLEKEPYIQNEIETYKENNLQLIEKINEEIKKIEILQETNLKQSEKKGDVNIYNSQKSFQNELLDLLKEKQNREKALKFATPYRVIQDFTVYNKPVIKAKTFSLVGAFGCFFIVLCFLIIKNLNSTINKKEI